MSQVVQADSDEGPEYKGNKGWVVIAFGLGGSGVVIDYDLSFGAFCYVIDGVGSDSVDDLGLDANADPGVYRGHFEAWTTSIHDYDGADNDMGFNLVGELETLWELS